MQNTICMCKTLLFSCVCLCVEEEAVVHLNRVTSVDCAAAATVPADGYWMLKKGEIAEREKKKICYNWFLPANMNFPRLCPEGELTHSNNNAHLNGLSYIISYHY